jgi:hypothetical protein
MRLHIFAALLAMAAAAVVSSEVGPGFRGAGLRLVASKETLREVRGVLDLVVTEQIRAALPVDLGSFEQKVGLSTLHVKDSVLRKTSHQGTGVTLNPGHGFTLSLLKFGCEIWADVSLSLLSSKGTIEVSDADLEMTFEVHATPEGSFSTVITEITVGNNFKVTPNFPGAGGAVFSGAIKAFAKTVIEKELPAKLPPVINAIAAQIIAGFQFEVPLGADLILDLRLPQDMVFTADDVSVFLVGELRPNPNTTHVTERCPYSPANKFTPGRSMLEVDIDEFVLNCAVWAVSRQLPSVERDLGALSIQGVLAANADVSLHDGGAVLRLPAQVNVVSHGGPGPGSGPPGVYVGVYTNMSINTSISAVADNVGKKDRLVLSEFVSANITGIDFAFGVAEFSPEVSSRDRAEALATDWRPVEALAHKILSPIVLKIDALIKTFPVQVVIPGVELSELQIVNTNDYIRAISAFKFNDTEIRTWNITELLEHPFEYFKLPNVTAIEEAVEHFIDEIIHALIPPAIASIQGNPSAPAGGLRGSARPITTSSMGLYASAETVLGCDSAYVRDIAAEGACSEWQQKQQQKQQEQGQQQQQQQQQQVGDAQHEVDATTGSIHALAAADARVSVEPASAAPGSASSIGSSSMSSWAPQIRGATKHNVAWAMGLGAAVGVAVLSVGLALLVADIRASTAPEP